MMDRLERVCLRKNEMSERRWQRRRAEWPRARLGNQEESDGGERTAAGKACGAGGAPHTEGGRRKEEKGAPGFQAGRRGCLRCVVRSWADERGCPVTELKGRQTDTSLGWTRVPVAWIGSIGELSLEEERAWPEGLPWEALRRWTRPLATVPVGTISVSGSAPRR